MKLEEILEGVRVLRSDEAGGRTATGVTHDSRKVGKGGSFVAIRGRAKDGLSFLDEAVRRGASVIVVGPGRLEEARRVLDGIPAAAGPRSIGLVEVEEERIALARMSRNAAGRPDLEMKMAGVTGTNGKTTTCHLLATMLEAGGVPCGLLGTVGYRVGSELLEADRTTPESADLHGYLRRILDAGAGACVMEVSSHALDLRRVDGIRFQVGIFTNLTRDHLDYHGDMESYFAAKRRLFEMLPADGAAVLNADDPRGRFLASETRCETVLYGESPEASFRLESVESGLEGLRVRIRAEGTLQTLQSPMPGRPNAFNLAAAATAARKMGVPWEAIRRGAASLERVPGRLERVDGGQPWPVLVDYAHTDDALRNVLETLRPLVQGRLLVVFGAGGDRDASKRPLMGEHAARLADIAWVTSDNPRTEDPMAIIGMIMEGVRRVPGAKDRCRVEPDRREAIRAAVREARDPDIVLIAGKGHERQQILAGRVVPFDDVAVARELIVERLGRERGGDGERS